ncbi:MAG: TRAP transporter large permease subunit [Myxococcales bacterium]|nr:TRAP transporter large permease subunit [Myxococcales bacterium]
MATVAAWAVSVVLAGMILLPVTQTVLRRFHIDLTGASVYVQHLTLWIGFIGAVLASVSGQNLSLSTVNLLPKGRIQLAAQIFSGAVTAAVTSLLAYGAFLMVKENWNQPGTFAGGIPLWCSEAIMPVTLSAIALRSIWRAPGGWTGRIASLAACGLVCALPLLGEAHVSSVAWPGAIVIICAFLLGTPVYVAMAGLAMLLFFADHTPIVAVPNTAFQLVTNSTLPVVPMLTIAGYVLAAGGASKRLVRLYRAWLGWMPGGMALMALFVCALFTALTGASGVTILAVGGVVYPSLREEKYPEGFSLGLVTAAGSLGLLFPPSLPVLLYAIKAETSHTQLYVAGLVPGTLIIFLVGIYAVIVGIRCKAPRHPFEIREALGALGSAVWDLLLPVVMVVAYASSFATLIEAAAIGSLYAIVIEVVIFRNLHPWRELPKVLADGATLVGSVVVLMGIALALTEYMTLAQIPDALLEWVQAHIHSQWGFLLALNVILLILGSVFEMYSAIILLAPLVAPIGVAFGVDPIHLGVVFLANLELGFLLPPMGLNLFLSATRFGKPLPSLYKHALPFLAIMTFGVLLVSYVEPLTTGVVRLLGVK